jgi:colanic acid/amylovoran biosynthesis glycosyltransferase
MQQNMQPGRQHTAPRLAYLVSKFPTITETFILREILEVERKGTPISLYTISRENPQVIHEDAKQYMDRLHVAPLTKPATWIANLQVFLKNPLLYIGLILLTLRELWGHWHLLIRDATAFPMAVAFSRTMKAEGIQHIHAHWATHTAYMAYIIHRLTGITYSFTAHAHDIYIRKGMLCRKVAAAEFVATISHFNREEMVRDCGEQVRNKIHIVRCGVMPEQFQSPQERPRHDKLMILTVASLRDYKGHPYAIEAAKLLKERLPNFEWLVIGGGPDQKDLEQQIEKLNVGDVYKLIGPKREHEVLDYMQKADVFVLPSIMMPDRRMEGLPVVLMEALAVELPTIATNISGISELVEDCVTGCLVPERNPDAMADAILYLAKNPEQARTFAQAGRQRVLEEFTIQGNAQRLINLFKQYS